MNSIKNALVSLGLFLNPIINKFANKTILFKAGNSIFVTEGLLVGIGTLFASQYLFLLLLLHGIKSQNAVILIYGLFLSSALCSRLFWWVGHFKEIKNQNALGIMNVGYVSWGGILGLIIFSFAFSFYFPYNFFLITDLIFRAIFIAYALGRLGCLTYGCCYGIKSNSFGINYNNVQSKAIRENGNVGFLRHPTQIYLFLNGCFLFITLNLFSLLNPPPGLTTAIAFLIYPIGRTYIEFFRDRKRLLKNIITEGHLGCISMFFLGWLLIFIIPFKFIDYPTEIWKIINLESNISLIPFSILIALFAFIVMGYHKGKVGTW